MEFTGKTVAEAIENGLEQLKLTKDDAKITIIQEAVKGLFGRVKENAKVDITPIERELAQDTVNTESTTSQENIQKAKKLVEGILELMKIDGAVNAETLEDKEVITLNASDTQTLIGYRGEVLDAIQTLASAMANKGNREYKKIVVDCENYRDKREDTLIKLAHKLEAKATEMRRDVMLEAMNPFERRIIHTALKDSQTVTTISEGKEPNRYVVICPNDKDENLKPYNAGRNRSENKSRMGSKSSRKGGRPQKSSLSPAPKKKTTITFGTYLGNSLKDKED